jgi:hypothetical protein
MTSRGWRWVLAAGFAVFVATRLATLMSFPVFNDEAIYLQYSQAIHADFAKNKFISQGTMYHDWKPPLQFWIGSVFLDVSDDPLVAGRVASFAVSLFGVWGLYLFVRALWTSREASLAVLVYALCPTVLFHNNQFVAETYVFSLTPWVYWFMLKAVSDDTRPAFDMRAIYFVSAGVFGALLLLCKQSGSLYLLMAVLLPAALRGRPGEGGGKGAQQWRVFGVRVCVVGAAVAMAYQLRRLGMPADPGGIETAFNGRWVLSLRELVGIPLQAWLENVTRVWHYYESYYSLWMIPLLLYGGFQAISRRASSDIAVLLGFLGGSAAVILLLKGFNEYMYNTAIVVFLVPVRRSPGDSRRADAAPDRGLSFLESRSWLGGSNAFVARFDLKVFRSESAGMTVHAPHPRDSPRTSPISPTSVLERASSAQGRTR